MKIYNKKGFWGGLFWLSMGILGIILYFYQGMNLRNMFLCGSGIFLGVEMIVRSLSRNMSDADQDERAKYVRVKSRSSAFLWSKVLCLSGGILYLGVFQIEREEVYMGMSIGFMLMFVAMIIVQGITEIYYEMRS